MNIYLKLSFFLFCFLFANNTYPQSNKYNASPYSLKTNTNSEHIVIDSIENSKDSNSIYYIRKEKPIFLFISAFDGIGIGANFFGIFEFQASSILLLSTDLKLKLLLFQKNSSPFIGIGRGQQYMGLGGNGESNDWTVLLLGWQFYPSKNQRFFCELSVQKPLHESNSHAFLPFIITYSAGFRIF